MRIASIDYGKKRIGIALSDANKVVAMPLTTLHSDGTIEDAVKQVKKILEPYHNEIELIIVGLPLLLSGKDSDITIETRQFIEALKKEIPRPVLAKDERFTSKVAETELKAMGYSRKKRSQKTDPFAATILLQNYLDSQRE